MQLGTKMEKIGKSGNIKYNCVKILKGKPME